MIVEMTNFLSRCGSAADDRGCHPDQRHQVAQILFIQR